ncbi:hypothetical protein DF049_06895 [Burkholderia cenocepacia]|nr:hypothetical protein DF049_06895 [Burkholderia cenocepacia]RQV09740.1 hypothetical protein DF042_01900 [Burkholderia cenocepacia]
MRPTRIGAQAGASFVGRMARRAATHTGVKGMQQMLHRNKAAGEVWARRVFCWFILRSITVAATQCNAAQNRIAAHRKENETIRAMTTACSSSGSLRRCTDAATAH